MSETPQFIFGYGSLIESSARARISPSVVVAAPVNVARIQRGWFGRGGGVGLGPTYLGAGADANSNCNGVIFPVSHEQLKAFDEAEPGYHRARMDQGNLTMLDGSESAPRGDIWFYANTEKHDPSPDFPIVQSYVDICLNGCLEIEATFPLAKEAKFAETFLQTSTNWSKFWVNDRIYPRRAFTYGPDASRIDALIKKVLGEELFSNIQIEPASWEGG